MLKSLRSNYSVGSCNFAIGQWDDSFVSEPWVNGTSCSGCESSECSNNLCSCNKICDNYGTLNKQTCTCNCQPYATGDTCETLICDKSDEG
jgi:hypothetical protein